MARKNPIFKKKSLIKFPKFSFKKSPIKFKKKNSKLAKILKFSLWSILAIVVFLTVAAVVGGESFDIRNYAKGNDTKEKVSCPSGCQGNYEWYYNRSEDKCKKRYSKSCAGTSTKSGSSNQKQDQEDSNNISCNGECITGIKKCTEKNRSYADGACLKGICCGGALIKPSNNSGSNNNNESDQNNSSSSNNTNKQVEDSDTVKVKTDPAPPKKEPTPICIPSGNCMPSSDYPCCSGIYSQDNHCILHARCG